VIPQDTASILEKVGVSRRDMGMFFTPDEVVEKMVSLVSSHIWRREHLRILEPACGMCQFLMGIKRKVPDAYRHAEKVGVEKNDVVVGMVRQYVGDEIAVVHGDYILYEFEDKFDLIIGNPPYGIPSPSSHYAIRVDNETKKLYKQICQTWYGKYNMYGAFIEKSVNMLNSGGELIFIVPATFMILGDFIKLRKFLAQNGFLEIYYMGENIFKPHASVTAVVIKFVKGERGGVKLYDFTGSQPVFMFHNRHWTGEIITFETEFSLMLENIALFRIGDIFDVKISPRTPEIKKASFVTRSDNSPGGEYVPILHSRNLKRGYIIYKPMSGYWVKETDKLRLRKFFDKPHIVVGLGFRGDRGMGAAYDERAYPWMGDVYHLINRQGMFASEIPDESWIVQYLNSPIVSQYVKDVYREIVYHFNIAQIVSIPILTQDQVEYVRGRYRWLWTGDSA